MRRLFHLIEAGLCWLVLSFFRLLPLDTASYLGGMLGRFVGKLAPQTAIARRNLEAAMPEKTSAEREKIIGDMWENLGRNAAEMPHCAGMAVANRVTHVGREHLPKDGEASLFVSGHVGNWELLASMAYDHGTPLTLVYRHMNNPYVDRMIARIRANHCTSMLPKGPKGALQLARTLKQNQSIAMLVDQKMNEGIAVPFFGRDAMTAPAIAKLALKFKLPITPARVIREKGVHFKGVVYPQLVFTLTGDEEKDVHHMMLTINQMLEGWIREYPEQWFWVHRRWPNN